MEILFSGGAIRVNMVGWTEKYRPKRLDDVIGNKKAKEELIQWAESWLSGIPKKRAVVLIGDPGIGKTTCAHALAQEMGWQLVEMNASDSRNADAIKKVATHGAMGETFTDDGDFINSKEGRRKLIVLDEADNVFGREDYGGIKAISGTISNTQQPIILIVNNYYELRRRSSAIAENTKSIKFSKPPRPSIVKLLKLIAHSEDITVADSVLEVIAQRCAGDVRSAINDLQSLAEGKNRIGEEDVSALGKRDTSQTVFSSLAVIFRTGNCRRSREAVFDLDEDPDTLLLWIDENIPASYKDAPDIAAAYEALAKADRFLGLVRRRQYYGLWGYASDMMSCGVSLAKSRTYSGYVNYAFPSWLRKMSASKGHRGTMNSFAGKLGAHTNKSSKVVLQEYLPYFRTLYTQDREFRLNMTRRLGLTEEEAGFLLGQKPDSQKIRRVFEDLRKVEAVGKTAEENVESGNGDEPLDADGDEPEPTEQEEEPGLEDVQSSLFHFE
jgi:replication factor C large subunit